jgi:hypothetical protein
LAVAITAAAILALPAGGSATDHAAAAKSAFITARHETVTPSAAADTLYDQYNNENTFFTTSQDFETGMSVYDDELADDFVIPGGVGWNISTVEVGGEYNGSGPANSVNVTSTRTAATTGRGRCSIRVLTRRSQTARTSRFR